MKRKSFRILFILLAAFFVASTSFSQNTSQEAKKKEKEVKKKAKQEQAVADWNANKKMAEDRQFVFKANQLITPDGTFPLDPKINFFYVIDDYSVIQFAFEGIFIGGNGLGGITSEGTIDKYKINSAKPTKPIQVELNVNPKAGQGTGVGTLVVKFFGDGYGEMLMNTSGYRLKGQIQKPENANIHQGNLR